LQFGQPAHDGAAAEFGRLVGSKLVELPAKA
jgi:hypothetical protein